MSQSFLRILLLLSAPVLAVPGCDSLPPRFDSLSGYQRPPEHIVQLVGESIRYGVATEEGILCLAEDAVDREIRVPTGKNGFVDSVVVDRRNENLGLLRPLSSVVPQARIGLYPARNDDELILAILGEEGEIEVIRGRLYLDGEAGDLLELPIDSEELDRFVATNIGAGVYAWRGTFFHLVGLLNGAYLVDESVVAFVGLEEIARILPSGSSFFERRLRVLRPDFEHGVVAEPVREGEESQ